MLIILAVSVGLGLLAMHLIGDKSKAIKGAYITVKFTEDMLYMTTKENIPLENVRISMTRENGSIIYHNYEPEIFKKYDRIEFYYPYLDLKLVSVEYFEEENEGGAQWVPYYLRVYGAEGE